MPFLRSILLIIAAASVAVFAEEPKPVPKPEATTTEASDEWLAAVERLRSMPLPGEFKNAGLEAGIGEVFNLDAAAKAEIKKLQDAYAAELLKRAAKWAEEETALRAEYESKVVAVVPEAKRESAKKALDFSHAQWMTPLDRDGRFKREFSTRVADLRENRAKLSVDELNEAREKMHVWVKEQRARLTIKDHEAVKQLQALLAKDDADRLQQFVHLRPIEAETPPAAPVGEPKADVKKDVKKKK